MKNIFPSSYFKILGSLIQDTPCSSSSTFESSGVAQVAFEIKASFYAVVVLQLVNVTTMLGTKKVNESQGYHLHKCKDALEA